MTFLSNLMARGIEILYGMTSSYGLAIILLTVLIRSALLPIAVIQTRSTARMQELAPKVEEIKRKFKDDPQRVNKETMELWKRHKVNPMAGCLLLLVQFPFIIALFRALNDFTYQGEASFLWIRHLGKPDQFYILPILAAATTFWQSKISMPPTARADSAQATMLYASPLIIGWVSSQFAAGLSLYWVVGNIYGIVQQYLTPSGKRKRKGDSGVGRRAAGK